MCVHLSKSSYDSNKNNPAFVSSTALHLCVLSNLMFRIFTVFIGYAEDDDSIEKVAHGGKTMHFIGFIIFGCKHSPVLIRGLEL